MANGTIQLLRTVQVNCGRILSAFANDSNINVLLEIHYTAKHGSGLDRAEIVVASWLDNALTDVYRIKSR